MLGSLVAQSAAMVVRAPAPSMSVLDGRPFCKGLPGAISPLGEFDPLGFSKDVDVLEVNRLREVRRPWTRWPLLPSPHHTEHPPSLYHPTHTAHHVATYQ